MKTIKFIPALSFCAAVLMASNGTVRAQTAVTAPSGKAVVEETKAEAEEEEKESWITGEVGTDVTNTYIYNGLVQDKDTLIVQPYLSLFFRLYEGEGFINNVTLELPLWWSVHDINKPESQGGNSSLRSWFEFDFSPGLAFTFAKYWTLTISDYIYTSPGDYFDTSHNLNFALSLDDSELMGAFALNPHFYFMQELDGHAGLGTKGDTLSQYYEFGIEPGCTLAKEARYEIGLTFPTAVGFGTNGFFGQGFGFFSTGVAVSVPLAFVPEAYGSWTTSLKGQYFRLGTDGARITDNPEGTRTGRRNQAVVTWSIGTEF